MGVRATFGESGLNSGQIICPGQTTGPVLRTTFVQYLIAFCSRLEATSAVISDRFVGTVVPGNHVKFGDHRLNFSQEILPEAL